MKSYKKVLELLDYDEKDWAYEVHKQIISFLFIKVVDNKIVDAKLLSHPQIYKAKELGKNWEYVLACYERYCTCNYCQIGGDIEDEIVEDENLILEVELDRVLEWVKKGRITKRVFSLIDDIALTQFKQSYQKADESRSIKIHEEAKLQRLYIRVENLEKFGIILLGAIILLLLTIIFLIIII